MLHIEHISKVEHEGSQEWETAAMLHLVVLRYLKVE